MKVNFEKFGIDVSRIRGTQGKTTCPRCSHTRKKRNEPCLSVDLENGLFNCHNCGFKGCAMEFERETKREYEKPLPRLEKLGKAALKFFEEDRKISNNTLLRFGITEGKEWMPQFEAETTVICFNYYQNGELVNIKFRGPKKSFKMAKNAKLIFYNLDAIASEEEAIICEGEIDCLSFHEAGIYNVVSVPNGASKGNQRLEYLDNCWGYFENKKRIILATDNDEPGIALRDELARRLGKERCFTVTYPDGCKDANEVLIKYGKDALREMINNAQEWPLEGVETVDDFYDEIERWYDEGYPKSPKPGIEGIDHMISFGKGMLTIITGIPGHGKDEFMNWIIANMSKKHEWRWGIASYEERSEITTTKIIEKYVGKAFAFRKNPLHRMTKEEFQKGAIFVHDHCYFLKTEEIERGKDALFARFSELVRRKGINAIIINPWNCIDHLIPPGVSETSYVSDFLSGLISLLKRYDLHGFLVAHPTKMNKQKDTGKYEIPTLYNISGSAHFYNKTHNGIAIYRDFESNITTVYFQKIKHSWEGQVGFSVFEFDADTRTYKYVRENSNPQSPEPKNIDTAELPYLGNWKPLADVIGG